MTTAHQRARLSPWCHLGPLLLTCLVAANFGDSTVSILQGKGDGTFGTAATVATPSGAYGSAASDFNADGSVDLAIAASGTAGVALLNGSCK